MSDAPRDTVPDGLRPAAVADEPSVAELQPDTRPMSPASASHAGAMLKAERERAGLHIGALAVALKVPVGKLEALESGAMEQSTSPVFVRALAASVCRQLKIDAEPILGRLPQSKQSPLKQQADLDAPFPTGSSHDISSVIPFNWRSPIALAVIALLAAAAALVYWPSGRFTASMPSLITDEVAKPAQTAASGLPPAGAAEVAAAPAASTAAAPEVSAPAASAASVVVPASTASGSSPASAAVPIVAAAVPVSGNDLLVLRATQPSWVEVTDARGAVVLRKTLEAGETATPTGTAPLKVIVGNAKFTEAWVKGQAVDIAGSTRDNVARFDAK